MTEIFDVAILTPRQEGKSNLIELHEDDEAYVKAMICFFYHAEIDEDIVDHKDYNAISTSVRMYAIGEKYLCDPFTKWAANRLCYHIQNFDDAEGTADAI